MSKQKQGSELPSRYRRALGCYLAAGGETALHEAYELGHEALHGGIGLLQFTSIHQSAAMELLDTRPASGLDGFVEKTGQFLREALAPFEMMQIGHRESNEALRHLNMLLEEEAGRIAQALHDDAAQMLATTYLELAALERRKPPADVGNCIQRIRSHLDQVSGQLRHISHELRSPLLDQFGLAPALKYLAEGVQKRAGLVIEVDCRNGPELRLPKPVENALYRAVQEALNNITRHAQANRASIVLHRDQHAVTCIISDDGIGFIPEPSISGTASEGLGLLGIRERARSLHGSLHIESIPGRGTILRITIPLEAAQS